VILVDVGVWLAAVWGRHAKHHVAARWFDDQSDDLILCRVTQMSLLRLISNPTVMGPDAVTRSEAWRVIDQLWSDDRVLWADEPDQIEAVFRAISARSDTSHKLWTDDYLAAFAQASGASLATLDTKMSDRYPSIRVEQLPGQIDAR
jgi:toxin-antitoxin system PIN domain toxin